MDTLVSLGVLAAFGWSLVALFWGTAGDARHDPPVRADRRSGTDGAGQHLPRGRRRRHHVPARRALLREALQAAGRAPRCARCSSWAPRTSPLLDGPTVRERLVPADQLAVGDLFVVRPGEKIATDGVVEQRHLGGRRLDAHRRVGAGRGRPRRRGRRRDRQRRRPARRPRHPGRRRHPAGADGPAGRGGPERQGRGAAARRPDLGGLRAGRDRARRRPPSASGSAPAPAPSAAFTAAVVGADHRLPVRAGPGHADRADGRHRPRRPARHPDPGPRGAGVDPPRRHRRARQDRHGHHRPDGPGRRGRRRRRVRRRRYAGSPARSRPPPSTRSPGPSPTAPATAGACPRSRTSRTSRASASQGVVDGPRRAGRPARGCSPTWSQHLPPSWTRPSSGRRPPAAPPSRSAGTAGRAACSSSPTPSSRPPPRRSRRLRDARPDAGAADRRQRARRPGGRRRGRASTR